MARTLRIGLAALALLALTSCAQMGIKPSGGTTLDRILEKGELVVGTAANMPPLNMTTVSGDIIGLEPDLANYLAYSMGVRVRFETLPFTQLLDALAAGKVDMVLSAMTITPRRNLKVAFAGPYFVSGKCILTKEESLANIESAAEMNAAENLTLTALGGSTSEEFIKQMIPKAKRLTGTDYDSALQYVLQGDADAMIADYPYCLVAHVRHPEAGLLSVITRLTYEPIGIALPANDPLLLNFVQNTLEGLAVTGRLDQLRERWFTQGDWIAKLK